MQRKPFIVNTSRGEVIETLALLDALKTGRYYDTFSELNDFSVGDCLRYDRILTQELAKQFIYQEAVYDVYLYTSKWLFGVNTGLMPITIDSFRKAGFEELARNASGLSCWGAAKAY